ncbi:MAG: glycosyltransferase [Candidatus Omnitrophota bacterium]|nr:MAG: glycosyltransferase [Candidatus Omnitrophota bacterium]
MMQKPFFSVIIPTHNRVQFLKIAIDSVFMQTFPDYEIIVIDDGSKDKTEHILRKVKDRRLRYISQPHQGVSSARNRGLQEARGRFVCFLDSDDRFRKEKLEVTHDCIRRYPEYKIFHTEEIWYRGGSYLPQKIYHKKPSGFIFKDAVKLCCVSISTAAINRDVFDVVGFFDESLPACEDYDLWLRITSRFPVFLISLALTIKEGGRNDQQSKKYPAMDKFRIYALSKILNKGKLSNENFDIAFEELRKKCIVYIKGALKRQKYDEAKKYEELVKKFKPVSYDRCPQTNP